MADAVRRSQTVTAFSMKGLQLRPKALKAILKALAALEDYNKSVQGFADQCKLHLRRNPTGSARTNFIEERMVEELLPTYLLLLQSESAPGGPDASSLEDPLSAGRFEHDVDMQDPNSLQIQEQQEKQERKTFAHLGDSIAVYNVFSDVPFLEYNTQTKSFQQSKKRACLFPEADRGPKMLQERMKVCETQLFTRSSGSSSTLMGRTMQMNALQMGVQVDREDVDRIQYYPGTHNFPNKQEICRGQSNLYRIRIPVVPRSTHHARTDGIEMEIGGSSSSSANPFHLGLAAATDDAKAKQPLAPGTMIAATEWYTSAHEKPEWYLKTKDGWIPYRTSIGGVEQDVVEPAGLPLKCMITSVESLVGNFGHKITFGLLMESASSDGITGGSCNGNSLRKKYALQEGRKRIDLNLKHFPVAEELIIHGGFYVVEGIVDNEHGVLHVIKMWNPPVMPTYMWPQDLHATVKVRIPESMNHFGGTLTSEDIRYLHRSETSYEFQKQFYVMLSDVNFDDPETFAMLGVLFDRFEDCEDQPHYVIVGNFRSPDYYFDPQQPSTSESWKNKLLQFSVLLQSYHHTQRKRVILVPGPGDHVGNPDVFPLPPLMTFGVEFPPNVIFATNPCRIRHYSKQIVISRSNIWEELMHAEAVKFEDCGDPARRFNAIAHYLLSQAHLCPILPGSHRNTMIGFDHALRLYPPPDVLCIGLGMWRSHLCKATADTSSLFLGSFTRRSQWGFYTYYPHETKLESMLEASSAVEDL